MMCGGIAGVASWLFLHPIDVLKSIQQGLPLDTPYHERTIKYIFQKNYSQYRYKFLFRGLLITCLRAFPASAITFPVFEWMIYLLDPILTQNMLSLSSPSLLSNNNTLHTSNYSNILNENNNSLMSSSSSTSVSSSTTTIPSTPSSITKVQANTSISVSHHLRAIHIIENENGDLIDIELESIPGSSM